MNQEKVNRWINGLVISAIIFLVFVEYFLLRRGSFSLSVLNKIFASTAISLASITLLVGPLRNNNFFREMFSYRRQMGLLAFILIIFHIIFSLLLQQRFPFPQWYLDEWYPVLVGLTAFAVWGYMTYISRNSQILKLGSEIWKIRLRQMGFVGIILVLFHIAFMKYEGWFGFLLGETQSGGPRLLNPKLPPESMLVFMIVSGILIFRLFEYFKKKNK